MIYEIVKIVSFLVLALLLWRSASSVVRRLDRMWWENFQLIFRLFFTVGLIAGFVHVILKWLNQPLDQSTLASFFGGICLYMISGGIGSLVCAGVAHLFVNGFAAVSYPRLPGYLAVGGIGAFFVVREVVGLIS